MTQVGAALVQLAKDVELWQADGQPMGTVGGQHLPLRGAEFRVWLLNAAQGRRPKLTPSLHAVSDAQEILAARAMLCPTYPLWRRTGAWWGAGAPEVWVDCGGCAEQVTKEGWAVQKEAPLVRFLRPAGQLALPTPIRQAGGRLGPLRHALPFNSDDQWVLWLAWLVFALQPTGAYPILSLTGPPHSGKSTLAEVTKRLVDPNTMPLLYPPADRRDLAAYVNSGWVIVLDNLTRVATWLSDALCGMSTGIGFAARQLYSDAAMFRVGGYRPIVVTSVGGWAARGDLQDRTLPLSFTPVEHSVAPDVVLRAVDAAHPAMLGWLLDTLAQSLGEAPVHTAHRFPWFLTVVRVVGERVGVDGLAAYEALREEQAGEVLSSSPIVSLLLRVVEAQGVLEGTTADLLAKLTDEAGGVRNRWMSWPRTPEGLGRMLRTLPLGEAGLRVEARRTRHGTRLLVTKMEE